MAKYIYNVGQCAFDNGQISRVASDLGYEVKALSTRRELFQSLQSGETPALVLLNRIFDADGDEGLEVLDSLKSGFSHVPVMLVSNYEDVQREALAKGALPGFGKNGLRDGSAEKALNDALALHLKSLS